MDANTLKVKTKVKTKAKTKVKTKAEVKAKTKVSKKPKDENDISYKYLPVSVFDVMPSGMKGIRGKQHQQY